MDYKQIAREIDSEQHKDLSALLGCLKSQIHFNMPTLDMISTELIDVNLLDELRNTSTLYDVRVYFGKTVCEFKCVLIDSGLREHDISLCYKGPKKLLVTSVQLPYSKLYDKEYQSLEELLRMFRSHVESLTSYFNELERIDRLCSVVDPVNPSFKEDYRRILLDDRIWLHVEVTPDGMATNVHLIGQFEKWQDKLQSGLLNWDHDKDIVENIMTMFGLVEFPAANKSLLGSAVYDDQPAEATICSICLCAELPDKAGIPQPLCQNAMCGVYFHTSCLFQWLVACAGGRPPSFGVATGACPACFQPITCSDRDS